jgi:hypothetical protein
MARRPTRTTPKLAVLRVGESTVECTTERVGRDVGWRLAEGQTFGENEAWTWSKDAQGETVAYVSADATSVGIQGANGAAAEGRMASVGMIGNAHEPGQVRYVCGLVGGLSVLGQPLRNPGVQVGMARAPRGVAISDGGAGIEDWLRRNFPRVEAVIFDFYHVAEHLNEWAQALHPDEAKARDVARTRCHRLKHESGNVVFAELQGIDVSRRSESVREAHRVLLVDFTNPVHRMDYSRYHAKGWLIGSGPVEEGVQAGRGATSRAPGCAGAMASATSAPCSAARKGTGTTTGPHSLHKTHRL